MGIKGIKKRVGCFMLAFSLSFGICATDYLEVHALEWAGTVIGLEEALKFLLGLLGVTVGVGVAENIDWQSMRENCIDFQIAQGQSSVAVSNWWADVIRGSLDTASSCWASFISWVKNDLLSSSSSGTFTMRDAILNVYPDADISRLSDEVLNKSYVAGYTQYVSGSFNFVRLFDSNFTCSFVEQNGSNFLNISFLDGSSSDYFYLSSGRVVVAHIVLGSNPYQSQISKSSSYSYYFYGFGALPVQSNIFDWDIGSTDIPSESDFDSAYENVQDIALAPDIATDLPYEGVIDIPWENVGATDEAVGEAIDGAQEKVITGEWTLDQYWTWVQNVTNVFAYDITNNYLLPNDGNNETADDKVQENVNRGAFVLAGLEKVFPFCIPWDIYAFVTLLVADPVAPVIEYPIYNPVTKDEEVITIDFSVWEQQVIIMRYIMDFLLIIGLLLLSRSLIGAGGSD